jgi:hypothetical protein
MTPKEKAQELFENMYYKIESDELGKDEESAKECALIAVDEIIDEYQKIFPNVNRRNYWDEVKQEIEKL